MTNYPPHLCQRCGYPLAGGSCDNCLDSPGSLNRLSKACESAAQLLSEMIDGDEFLTDKRAGLASNVLDQLTEAMKGE